MSIVFEISVLDISTFNCIFICTLPCITVESLIFVGTNFRGLLKFYKEVKGSGEVISCFFLYHENLDKKFMEISVPIFFFIIFIFLYISIQYSSEVFTHMYQYAPFHLMEASL